MGTRHVFCFIALLVLIIVAPALAGWTVTYIQPAGYDDSCVYGISGGVPAGEVKGSVTGNQWHASVWRSGTAESFRDLNPSGSDHSVAYGISGVWVYADCWHSQAYCGRGGSRTLYGCVPACGYCPGPR